MTSICAFNFAYKLKISIYNNLIKIFDFHLLLLNSRARSSWLTCGSEDMLCNKLSIICIKLQDWRSCAMFYLPLDRASKYGLVWLCWAGAVLFHVELVPVQVPELLDSEEPVLESNDHLNARHSHRSGLGGPGVLLPVEAGCYEYR